MCHKITAYMFCIYIFLFYSLFCFTESRYTNRRFTLNACLLTYFSGSESSPSKRRTCPRHFTESIEIEKVEYLASAPSVHIRICECHTFHSESAHRARMQYRAICDRRHRYKRLSQTSRFRNWTVFRPVNILSPDKGRRLMMTASRFVFWTWCDDDSNGASMPNVAIL